MPYSRPSRWLDSAALGLHLFLFAVAAWGQEAPVAPPAEEAWVAGTATASPITARAEDDAPTRAALQSYLIAQKDFSWRTRLKTVTERVRIHELEMESAIVTDVPENNTIRGFYYEPLAPCTGKRPCVVVLHHLGGEFTAEEMLAKTLAENGFESAFMYFPYYKARWPKDSKDKAPGVLSEDLPHSLKAMQQAVLDVHRVGDWVSQRPNADRERLGLTGISLGAVIGSLTSGVDTSFRKVALVLAGGNIAEVAIKQLGPEKVDAKLKAAGMTIDAIKLAMIPVEPLTFAHRVNARNILMLNATNDEIIPKDATRALWKALGKPRVKWYRGGHYSVSIYVADVIKEVCLHLQSPVLPPGEPVEPETSSTDQPPDQN